MKHLFLILMVLIFFTLTCSPEKKGNQKLIDELNFTLQKELLDAF